MPAAMKSSAVKGAMKATTMKSVAMKSAAKGSTAMKAMKAVSSSMKAKAMSSAMKSTMKAKAAKPMKKVMKTTAMKKKKVKVSKRGKKWQVFKGSREKTNGGLDAGDLKVNTAGRIVSKKKSDAAKARYAVTIKPWLDCVLKAKKEYKAEGKMVVLGRGDLGAKVLDRARMYYDVVKQNKA